MTLFPINVLLEKNQDLKGSNTQDLSWKVWYVKTYM